MCVREALNGVQRAVEITNRLQGLSGSKRASAERLRLSDIVRTLLPLFENRIAELGVTVNLELHETPSLMIDQSQLGFIVTSLVTNSLDAVVGQPRRVMTLHTGTRHVSALLEVQDHRLRHPFGGHGTSVHAVFHHKGRVGRPGSPQAQVKGVGLSLAVCHSTVSERGGRIEVESDVP